ncbi:MAG TPA: DUF4129 domain-containing protein [Gemmataceae bacterium]|nr:DUF4129 domain-containing protein [Gemmataceae bacterium]
MLYVGKYEGKLLYTLFFFVFGIVLVARISIVVDPGRSKIYGLVLAAVCWIALQAYVDFPADSSTAKYAPVINAGLLLVVWWCANKLTWDCTFIDERRESSSRGLLAVVGMDQRHRDLNRGSHIVAEDANEPPRDDLSLLERIRRYREARAKRPHTPGVTVIWFSLAALPIFGLGQSLIPPEESSRRSFTFWLAAVYVGSAMGLLLTTSFLGLRRYLRQRRLQMPLSMTSVWMGSGVVLVVAFLAVGAILPRPYSETPIITLRPAGSEDRAASKNAVHKDGAGKGEGASGNETTKGKGDSTAKGGEPGGKGKDGESKEGSGSDKGKESGSNGSKKGDDGSGKGKDGPKDGKSEKEASQSGRPTSGEPKDGQNRPDSYERFQNSSLGRAVEKIGTLLKWLVFIVVLVIVLALLFRGGLAYLANFFPWARRLLDAISAWWQRLFGRRPPEASDFEVVDEESGPTRVPFSAFSNPFADGSARRRRPAEVVAYSFAALEAWAADHDQPRRDDETPLEFAERLQSGFPALEPEVVRLANLVARVAYAGSLPANAGQVLEEFWDRITTPVTEVVAD